MYSSLTEAINGISNKITVFKLKEENNNVYDDKEKAKILVEIKKNEEDVRNNINAIYNTMVNENPKLRLVRGLLLDVANYVAFQVEEKRITSPEQIRVTSGITTEILKSIKDSANNYQNQEKNSYEIIQNLAAIEITKEGLENFQKNMEKEYGHNYFQANDFEQVEKENEEITTIIGKENIGTLIQKANNGDKDSAVTLMIVQNAQIMLGFNSNVEKIPEDRMQSYLKNMILLSEYADIPEIKKIYEKMSEKLPEEYFEGSGEARKVSEEKLIQMYILTNDFKSIDIEFLKDGYRDVADQYIQNAKYQFKSAEDFTIENTIEGQMRMLQRNYYICQEQARKSPEDYKYALYELRENSKKYLDASLRLAEEMSFTGVQNSDLETFKNLIESVLEGLAEAKEGTEFVDDEYTKASKKNLFRWIINNKEFSNQNLLEKIVKVDSELAKEILKEMLEEYNDMSDKTIGGNIQVLGEIIKKVSQEEKALPDQDDNKRKLIEDDYDAR